VLPADVVNASPIDFDYTLRYGGVADEHRLEFRRGLPRCRFRLSRPGRGREPLPHAPIGVPLLGPWGLWLTGLLLSVIGAIRARRLSGYGGS